MNMQHIEHILSIVHINQTVDEKRAKKSHKHKDARRGEARSSKGAVGGGGAGGGVGAGAESDAGWSTTLIAGSAFFLVACVLLAMGRDEPPPLTH